MTNAKNKWPGFWKIFCWVLLILAPITFAGVYYWSVSISSVLSAKEAADTLMRNLFLKEQYSSIHESIPYRYKGDKEAFNPQDAIRVFETVREHLGKPQAYKLDTAVAPYSISLASPFLFGQVEIYGRLDYESSSQHNFYLLLFREFDGWKLESLVVSKRGQLTFELNTPVVISEWKARLPFPMQMANLETTANHFEDAKRHWKNAQESKFE